MMEIDAGSRLVGMAVLALGNPAHLLRMVLEAVQALLAGDWRSAYVAIAPLVIISLLFGAFLLFVGGDSSQDLPRKLKKWRRR